MYGQIYSTQKQYITYQQIINSTNQLDLWSWFFNFRLDLGQHFCNPMRQDQHPNCFLSWGTSKTDFIVLNDFGNRGFHGMTVFDAIVYKENIPFELACDKIYEEFMLPNKITTREAPIGNQKRKDDFKFYLDYIPWTLNGREVFIKHDKIYWEQYGISSDNLKEDNVKSNRSILFNSRSNPTNISRLEVTPSYTILFDSGRKKCYNPYHSTQKWISTCTEEDIWGWDSLKNTENVIITKSYKDHRVLKNSGYNTIALQNEGCKIPFDKLLELKQYKTKFILFDNDRAGIEASIALAAYANQIDDSYIPLHFDTSLPKDAADIVSNYSNQVLEEELLNLGIE